jgi:hypothetical protein
MDCASTSVGPTAARHFGLLTAPFGVHSVKSDTSPKKKALLEGAEKQFLNIPFEFLLTRDESNHKAKEVETTDRLCSMLEHAWTCPNLSHVSLLGLSSNLSIRISKNVNNN